MSSRPKRTTRATTKAHASSSASSSPAKSNATPKHIGPDLSTFLTSSKSALTRMDISDIFNIEAWTVLSDESKEHLLVLLPPTAFHDFRPSVDSKHPSRISMDEEQSSSGNHQLDTSIFKDTHFISASHVFQDHIYSGWKTDAHKAKLEKYLAGIRDGTLAAPWKDDAWEKENTPLGRPLRAVASSSKTAAVVGNNERADLAGEAANVSLGDLIGGGAVKVGDIMSYKRNFSVHNILVEKDVVVESLNPKNKTMTVLLPTGTTQYLPSHLLTRDPATTEDPSIRSITFSAPSALENGILDTDGRVDKGKRPNGNAWKTLTVWRWPDDEGNGGVNAGERFGRESHGTLFYIRGCFYHDR